MNQQTPPCTCFITTPNSKIILFFVLFFYTHTEWSDCTKINHNRAAGQVALHYEYLLHDDWPSRIKANEAANTSNPIKLYTVWVASSTNRWDSNDCTRNSTLFINIKKKKKSVYLPYFGMHSIIISTKFHNGWAREMRTFISGPFSVNYSFWYQATCRNS